MLSSASCHSPGPGPGSPLGELKCLAEGNPTGSQPLCPAAECRWWLRLVEGLLLWEEGGVLYKSHPSQVCTAPGHPVSMARRHA